MPYRKGNRVKCYAVIGDMVGSRSIAAQQRQRVQRRFTAFVKALNEAFAKALLSKFTITLGDEFQGLIADPAVIPDLVWRAETEFTERPLRLGFGFGPIDTEIPKVAINVDGPALHAARAAIDEAKNKKRLGGVFRGETIAETELNGFARLMWFHRSRRTEPQLKVLGMLRNGMTQVEVARLLHQSPQSIYDHAKAAGWEAYREAQAGFVAALIRGHK